MVYLAISKQGLADAISTAANSGDTVWCGSDAISAEDYQKQSHKALSRFVYPLQTADKATLEDALETIAEHHPNETIWVESRAEA